MADALPLPHHPDVHDELAELARRAPREYAAVRRAIALLHAMGPQLGFPHSSAIQGRGQAGLRELRPRQGRSRIRVLYAPHGSSIVLLAIAPEAMRNRRGFARAVDRAHARLAELNTGDDDACN